MNHQISSPGALVELEEDVHPAKLVRNWDFSVGKRFEANVFRKFASSVHHPSSSLKGSFFLVAILCRYLFRLTEESVSMALHCCLRGTLASFHVTYLQDRHSCFSVVSKVWVFWFELSKESPQIILMFIFHLWRDGGEDWVKERKKWELEEEASWSPVIGKHNMKKNS